MIKNNKIDTEKLFFKSKDLPVSFCILYNGRLIHPGFFIQIKFSILFFIVGLQVNPVPVCVVQVEKPG